MDKMENLKEHASLNLLIQKQPDFISELTLLQHVKAKVGALVDMIPKCHPEMAGEGIEYIWALAKLYFQNYPLKM
jgi:hypothetical protein